MKSKFWSYHTLLPWFLTVSLMMPAAARCMVPEWLTLQGLDGVQASVALATDPTLEASLDEMKRAGKFEPLPGRIREHGGIAPIWLRVTLAIPTDLLGSTAWLEIRPAHQWEIQVYTADGKEQRGGFGIDRSQRSYASATPRFPIDLSRPETEIYLRIVTAAAQLTHVSLISGQLMQENRLQEEWYQGIFWGATTLILAITFLNWFWNRNPLYKIFSFYLAGASVLMLFMDGHITAYMFGDFRNVSRMVIAFASCLMIVSHIYFGIQLLEFNKQYPRTTRYLQYLAALILCSPILTLNLSFVYVITNYLMGLYFLFGLGLVFMSAYQAWEKRSPRAMWICLSLMLLSAFDKGPVLAILGLLPVQSWTIDLFKIGMLIQMILAHALLLITMQEQQRAKALMEKQSLMAAADARSEYLQRTDLTGFLAMFGHEVRTPLAIIDTTTQSLELLPGAELPEFAQRHARIRAAVARLDHLANLALARERIETLGWTPNIQSIALQDILAQALEKFELDVPNQVNDHATIPIALPLNIRNQVGGTLTLSLPVDLPLLHVDALLLQLVLENLVDNACKYGDAGSTVKLVVETLPPIRSLEVLQAKIKISVDSQGPVLSQADLDKSFEKYWRRDEHSDIGGAGLGLYLVQRIAKLHGGIAEACSFPGRWTRFSIIFPIQASTT